MSRKLRWAATGMPAMRRALVAAERGMVEEATAAGQALRFYRVAGVGPHELEQIAERSRVAADRLLMSDLYWVTHPMARVAMDAARDVEGFDIAHAPSPVGLIAFQGPLPPLHIPGGLVLKETDEHGIVRGVEHTDPVPVDAVAWWTTAGQVHIAPIVRSERLPLPLYASDPPLTPFAGAQVERVVPDLDATDLPDDWASLLALLSSAWHLMQIPTLAERRSLDAEWGGEATAATRPDRVVTTIDLRPLRHVVVDRDEQTGRTLTHRHWVRGHWRSQPHGPDRALRKRIFVEPFIKGPEGAPLVDHEKVMVWRR